jgi:ABC-2 type transport system permease protein
MLNLLKNEFYKLKNSKVFYLMILLNIFQGIFIYGFSDKLMHENGKESLLYMFNLQSAIALNTLIGIFAVDYIVTEFSSGYIKNLISYGHKRINIFISKSIAYYVGVIIISSITPLGMGIINTIVNGFGKTFNFNELQSFIKTFLLIMLIQIAIASIGVFLSFAFKSANVTIIAIVAMDFGNRIYGFFAFKNSALRLIYDKIIFSQISIVLSDKVKTFEIFQAIILSFIVIVTTTLLGIYIFEKSEIK